jgi:hypothetical protein
MKESSTYVTLSHLLTPSQYFPGIGQSTGVKQVKFHACWGYHPLAAAISLERLNAERAIASLGNFPCGSSEWDDAHMITLCGFGICQGKAYIFLFK